MDTPFRGNSGLGTPRRQARWSCDLRSRIERVAERPDSADLDSDLTDALIQSARMQLPGNARFAAAAAQRIDGRYNVLGRAVFSPCSVRGCMFHWRLAR